MDTYSDNVSNDLLTGLYKREVASFDVYISKGNHLLGHKSFQQMVIAHPVYVGRLLSMIPTLLSVKPAYFLENKFWKIHKVLLHKQLNSNWDVYQKIVLSAKEVASQEIPAITESVVLPQRLQYIIDLEKRTP